MALPDLASGADISDRGVTPTSTHITMLGVASSLVRQAAGSPILQATSTVTLWGLESTNWLDLPGAPVKTVSSVVHDGSPRTVGTDCKLVHGRLWGSVPWGNDVEPLQVTVTMTHGFTVVPAHIVNLVCDLAILGAAVATDGAHDPRVIAESIDDYSVTFASGAESVASAMDLPPLTKRWLRAQFGGGAGVVAFL